ncbi:MAG: Asp-tRNA(Asn)/Glu-tRNA(Gln) amidotransferase subunit GatC [Elusimicrobia bacterium]|nr:Asp-tRNA(Asn)/Glu-tRNA(Gln) amidotransferase subunit GatC [Elusimicrobiota bacterium]
MDRDGILRIAKLARLEIEDGKIEKFTEEFNKILSYFEKLGEVNTKDISPFLLKNENVLREDEVIRFKDRDRILGNAPDRQDDFFKVKKVIEE